MNSNDALVVFEGAKIRRIWHNEQWYFSVVDIIQAITNSRRPRKYWPDLKKKPIGEGFELYEKIGQLKIEAYVKYVQLKIAKRIEHRAFNVNTDRRYR